MKKCLLAILWVSSGWVAHAQQISVASLDASFRQYAAHFGQVDLFLHIDKSIYTPNETIWFTAYILNDEPIAEQHTLQCLLVEDNTGKIATSQRFVINQGLGGGSLLLPDTLKAGGYKLLAYTNNWLTHQSGKVFQCPLTVKTREKPPFQLMQLPTPTTPGQTDSLRWLYKVTTSYGGIASGADFNYTILINNNQIESAKKRVDAFGEVKLALPNILNSADHITLKATISRNKKSQIIKTALPMQAGTAYIQLFPESGNAVAGHTASVGVSIRNGQGVPIATNAQIMEDSFIVEKFTTDIYGLGHFKWTPKIGKHYTIYLEDSTLSCKYTIPQVHSTGLTLHVPQACVKEPVVRTELEVSATGQYYVMMHNYRSVFYTGKMEVTRHKMALQLPVNGLPDGVITVTIFDQDGQPMAERAIFVGRTDPLFVKMTVDSNQYHSRSKVRLNVKVTDTAGNPVSGFFSLACVQASRLDTNQVDIARFAAFDRYLPAMTELPSRAHLSDPANLENVLLTKFWTRYRWETFKQSTTSKLEPCDAGTVLYKNGKVRQPVKMVAISGDRPHIFLTDAKGKFDLPHHFLYSPAEMTTLLLPSENESSKFYTIELVNHCQTLDSTLAGYVHPGDRHHKASLSVAEQETFKQSLKAVEVKATLDDNTQYSNAGEFFRRRCEDDWYCLYKVLNCPIHDKNANGSGSPVNGMMYFSVPEQRMVAYKCSADRIEKFIKMVKGIYYPKEFYAFDFSAVNPSEPVTPSTIFWSYKIIIDQQGQATVTFSTGDLKGRFACILQGYTPLGMISATAYFRNSD